MPLLRGELSRLGLDGFLVPHEDEFQNEYLPSANDRLAWLTGFTGSAGAAAVLMDKAAVFADGRYTLQVRAQTDPAIFEPQDFRAGAVASWVVANAKPGAKIGYDPWVHSIDAVEPSATPSRRGTSRSVPVAENPIDRVWAGRPPQPLAPVLPHTTDFSGEASPEKRARLAKRLSETGADAAVITSPASIAWLLNVRGGDVAHTPLPLARAILHSSGNVDLYLDDQKGDARPRRAPRQRPSSFARHRNS